MKGIEPRPARASPTLPVAQHFLRNDMTSTVFTDDGGTPNAFFRAFIPEYFFRENPVMPGPNLLATPKAKQLGRLSVSSVSNREFYLRAWHFFLTSLG
jgi:hypothetical protein